MVPVRTEIPKTISLSTRRTQLAAVLAVAISALILFYLGWVLPSVGGSLVVPTLIVLGTGVAFVLVIGLILRARASRTELIVLIVGSLVVVGAAAVWTFQFALPLALWTSGATAQARAALSQAARTPQGILETAPAQPCVNHTSGSVGPLRAPYSVCATSTPEGQFVTFTSQSGGLGYAEPGAENPYPDECVRHLYGNWSMFTDPSDSNGDPGSCPIGYQFQDGG